MDALKAHLNDTKDTISKLLTEVESKENTFKAITTERKAISGNVIALRKQYYLLELKCEKNSNELEKCETSLTENIAAMDESRRATNALQKKQADQEALLSQLNEKAIYAKDKMIESQERYNVVLQRLKEIENKTEKLDACNDVKQKQILELEKLSNCYSMKLKSFQMSEGQATESVQHTEEKIKKLTEQLKVTTLRARKAEEEAQLNQLELSQMEDELVDWKDKNTSLRCEIDRINVDLAA